MQVPELTILLFGATDKQQELSDLSPDEWSLLNHQILGKERERTRFFFVCLLPATYNLSLNRTCTCFLNLIHGNIPVSVLFCENFSE